MTFGSKQMKRSVVARMKRNENPSREQRRDDVNGTYDSSDLSRRRVSEQYFGVKLRFPFSRHMC